MDDSNITMEEYIRLEEEKARRHGQTFNWQTATFRKIENYKDEDDCFIDFETEFTAIVFDKLTAIPSDPTVCPPNENEIVFRISLDESDDEDYTVIFDENSFSYKMISVNDLKTDSKNENNNMPSSPNPTIDDLDFFKEFKNEFQPLFTMMLEHMAPLPAANQRHPWLRYQIEEYNEGIRHSYEQRLETIWSRPVNRVHVLDFEGLTPRDEAGSGSEIEDGVLWRGAAGVHESCLEETIWDPSTFGPRQEMTEAGFGAYWDGSDRLIPDKGDLNDYWIEISSDRDFLGLAPSYVLIRDPVKRLCHMMISYSVSGEQDRGQATRGHFIGSLAMHFGLVSNEGLRGLQVVTRELPLIDLHELGRLNICTRYGDTWAWVSQGPERQQAAAAGAHEADEAGPVAEEVASEISAPAQAPAPPPPAPQPWTMSQRIERVEEEMHDLWRDVLMDASGLTYQAFDTTLVGSSRMPYQRRVMPRTGDASTSTAPHTDAQPDP
ncbi:hypothetical protein Tco_0379188 [Tanacetum coccineum]